MKEQLLNPSDRAALQGLIPLAGALGAGTIFALFFGGRRRGSGIAVFELFAIVAVLVSVATTAYFAISLLHADEPLTDRELTQTAMPLIFAVFLLVLVSVLARLPGSAERIFSVLPLLIVAGFLAAYLASSAWSFKPGDTVPMAILILGIGGLAALLAWAGERLDSRWERRSAQRRFVRLAGAGYRVVERELLVALPTRRSGGRPASLSCWSRKDSVYLDRAALLQLRERARSGWDRLAEEKGSPPVGPLVVTEVYVSHWLLGLFGKRSARISVFEPAAGAEIRVHGLEANDDRLFDLTGLGLV